MSRLDFNDALSRLFREKGVSLKPYGSAEFGLSKDDANYALEIINVNGQSILGVEVWRGTNGHYVIDSLDGWCSSGANNSDENYRSVQDFMRIVDLGESDLLTIQFTNN